MMKSVVILNGRPRSGKDTAIGMMIDILREHGTHGEAFSSIDPVRHMLTDAGFDLSAKTEADRALLADVGDAVEHYNQFRTRGCLMTIEAAFSTHENCVVFIHMREPALIRTLRQKLAMASADIRVVTCLLQSTRADMAPSNQADSGVSAMRYDEYIDNDGSLDDLESRCILFLWRNSLIEQLALALV